MSRAAAGSGWIVYPAPRPAARARLFCLPHGGAAASVFREWPAGASRVEIAAVQLPGRESRLREPPIDRMERLVDELHEGVRTHLDRPYAFYGHSVGARVAFELTRRLRAAGDPLPAGLYVSGCPAPQAPQHAPAHGLPDAELAAMLRRLGGTPAEVFEFPDLLAMLLAVVRADFALAETCAYREEPPLDRPIRGFAGTADPEASPAEVDLWRAQTTAGFSLHVLPGDHFFPWTHRAAVLGLVESDLG